MAMDPRLVEIALRKQRLRLRAEIQREQLASRFSTIDAALNRVDGARAQLAWAREKAPLFSIAVLTVLALKPRLTLRLARRAWLGWVLLARTRNRLQPVAVPLLRRGLKMLKGSLSRTRNAR